jgi:hypothetical protein
MMRSSVVSRLAFLVGALTLGSGVAVAQSGAAQASPFAIPNATDTQKVNRYPISKAVFADAGIIVNARDDGFIEVAAAGPKKTILLQLRAMAARAWLDSTGRILRTRPKRSADPRTFRSDIREYGTNATMALTRTVTSGQSEYSLYFADDPSTGFTVPIEQSEADVFVAVVRKAVDASVKMLDKTDTAAAPKTDSAPPKKKKPAVKRAAPPPVKADSTKPATAKPASTTPATSTPKPQATKPKQPA